jgi:hypothetical protein
LLANSDGVQTVLTTPKGNTRPKATQNLLALLAGAALVVGLAGIVAFVMKQSDAPSTDASSRGPERSTLAQAPAARSVRIETSPAGAMVRSAQGRSLCAPTPCTVAFREQDQPVGYQIVVAKDGFREESRKLDANDRTVTITLTPSQP